MVVNTDNILLFEAIRSLYVQAKKIFPNELESLNPEKFYQSMVYGSDDTLIRLHTIKSGEDAGKLTLERRIRGDEWEVVDGITPVDYLNLVGRHNDLASAVRYYYG